MDDSRADFERLLDELRPRLHRYCARVVGSVIDGEDLVQETLVKAIQAFPRAQPIDHPEGWLFRIAHNAALDLLRRRAREEALMVHDGAEQIADQASDADRRLAAVASLDTLMHLPVAQRASVILMDVLGYSLQEVAEILALTVAAIKANLHRGRERLRNLATAEPQARAQPALTPAARARLQAYIDRFNARDFDAVRALLADEVRVDVVGRARLKGRGEASTYFGNYSRISDWRLVPGLVEGRAAALVHDPRDPACTPRYFILLDWTSDGVSVVRDFRHLHYVIDGADLVVLS
jgi:RNA polymerase sigma-70 factor (ECF subfamily)